MADNQSNNDGYTLRVEEDVLEDKVKRVRIYVAPGIEIPGHKHKRTEIIFPRKYAERLRSEFKKYHEGRVVNGIHITELEATGLGLIISHIEKEIISSAKNKKS